MREEIIGNARLILGDAREILPGIKCDHIITDPPYGESLHANFDANARRQNADGSTRSELGYAALTPEEAVQLAALFHEATPGWIVWMTDSDLAGVIRGALKDLGRTTFPPLPFFHRGRNVRLSGDGPSSWTDWIVVARTPAQSKWGTLQGGYVAGPGWDDKERMGGKPTRLMRLMVQDYSRPGELVCDPFMGAGTTGVAAWQEGRAFVGIEIDPAAFDISCRRIEAAHRQSDLFGAAA